MLVKKVFPLAGLALALCSCSVNIPTYLDASPSAPLSRRDAASNPSSLSFSQPATLYQPASNDFVYSYWTYSSTADPTTFLSPDVSHVYFVWLESAAITSNGIVYPNGGRFRVCQIPKNFLYTGGQYWYNNRFLEIWQLLLSYGDYPVVAGYTMQCDAFNDSDGNVANYKWTYTEHGMVRPRFAMTIGGTSYAHVEDSEHASVQEYNSNTTVWTFDFGVDEYYTTDYDTYSYYRLVCSSTTPYYALAYSSFNAGYYDGYADGSAAVVSADYDGLTYEQIYTLGEQAGTSMPTQINLYDMFAAVITMPFTMMASTFDTTLFEGTSFAFNVSVFIYSVFIILLVWKILSLVLRGK